MNLLLNSTTSIAERIALVGYKLAVGLENQRMSLLAMTASKRSRQAQISDCNSFDESG